MTILSEFLISNLNSYIWRFCYRYSFKADNSFWRVQSDYVSVVELREIRTTEIANLLVRAIALATLKV
jgi:hypothetical protein